MAARRDFRLMAGGKDDTKGKKKNSKRKKSAGGRKNGSSSGQSGKKGGFVCGIVLLILCILSGTGYYIVRKYRIENIAVEGNVHYTSEEITDMVLADRLSYNSIYLSLKYRNKEIKDIPFIETMSVKILAPDTIKIMVYEKTVAGYMEYMGRYIYFDRDGIVVESSGTKTEGIPQVTGVKVDHVVLYDPLPVEDSSIFQQILSITQMLSKYEISTDKIYFNDDREITLYFDGVRAKIGSGNLEEKIMRLQHILPSLEGKSGVLKMENYSQERENITFEGDK